MSYINEALKKAQEEKNSRYGKLDCVASGPSATNGAWIAQRRKAMLAAGFLVFAGISVVAALLVFSLPPAKVPDEQVPAKKAVAPPIADPKKVQEETRDAAIRDIYEEAAAAGRKGAFAKAGALYEKALKLAPENVETLNNLGVVYLAEKKRGKALALFRRAILLKRDYVDPYYNMACLYAQKRDIDQSLWYLKMAISIDKDVINWAGKDADMQSVVTSPKFKEIDGGAKN